MTGVFTPEDDRFHFDVMSDRWWETETAWFSFHDAPRRLGGWFYTLVRPNIGTVAGGAWVWDDKAWLPWDVPYSANYSAMPLPRDQDLDDIHLPTGVSIKVVEPCTSYELGYEDGDRLTAALRFDAVMPPQPLTAAGSTFGSAHHFDQIGRVHGHLVLHGERVEIDCLGMRDRTWGPRPEHRPRQAAYVTGAADPDQGFLAVTNTGGAGDPIAFGFLRRDGLTANLAEGHRRVERDREHGWVTRLTIEATDEHGRTLVAVGEPVSRMIINRHLFIDINTLVRWDLGGVEAWGEDQDMWPVHAFAERQRLVRR
ncbi:MAG: hypothetical protein GEV08_02205 [Acidimicrobiia bacterium]|nr:hypothetical protein [Acidimicrobiia bacterium]